MRLITLISILFLVSGCQIRVPKAPPLTEETVKTNTQTTQFITDQTNNWQTLNLNQLANRAAVFNFTVSLPNGWQAEAITAIEAINIYDPKSTGQTNLEKSQIFMRYFQANDFLTLKTVTIYQETETKVAGRPAVVYEIEKKANIAPFPNQPFWRNQRHLVTDIRLSPTSPSIFYVIAKRPDLSQDVYQTVLNSLKFSDQTMTKVVPPIAEFKQRINKKPFGIYITPKTSPVQPERFFGYHTGVDVEYQDGNETIPVKAIADGTVELADWVAGYGGVIAIRHSINDQNLLAIYGHLKPNSLAKKDQKVIAGQTIGVLGQGGTEQTDGERKHLHFGLYRGLDLNLSGYVNDKNLLNQWLDPLTVIVTDQ